MTAQTTGESALADTGAPVRDSRLAAQLRKKILGPVFLPEDDNYSVELAAFNSGLHHQPDVVIGASCGGDVSAAVEFATDNALEVSVLGTGHAPYPPVRGGVMITTRRMSRVTIDPAGRTATVAAGTTWGEVVEAAAGHGLAAVCGSAPAVGAIGMTLGGGLGPLGRTFGFSAEHVGAMQVVGPDGIARLITADTDPSGFWALRGGKRHLGIVTEMTIDLRPLTSFYGGRLLFSSSDIPALLSGYQAWLAQDEVADELTTSLALLRLPDLPALPPALRGRTVGALRIGYVGDAQAGAAATAPLLTAIGREPIDGALSQLPYHRIGDVHGDPTRPAHHRCAGLLLRSFDEEAAHALLHLAGPTVSVPLAIVEIRHLGGAYARGGAGAVSGRDAAFNVWVSSAPLASLSPDDEQRTVHGAIRKVIDGLTPWSFGGAQINFTGTDNTDSERAHGFSAQQTARLDDICLRRV